MFKSSDNVRRRKPTENPESKKSFNSSRAPMLASREIVKEFMKSLASDGSVIDEVVSRTYPREEPENHHNSPIEHIEESSNAWNLGFPQTELSLNIRTERIPPDGRGKFVMHPNETDGSQQACSERRDSFLLRAAKVFEPKVNQMFRNFPEHPRPRR